MSDEGALRRRTIRRLRHLGVGGRIGLGFGFVMLILLFQSTMGFLAASQSGRTMQVDIAQAQARYEIALDLRTQVDLADLADLARLRGEVASAGRRGDASNGPAQSARDRVNKLVATLMQAPLSPREKPVAEEMARLTAEIERGLVQLPHGITAEATQTAGTDRDDWATGSDRRRELAGQLVDSRRDDLNALMQTVSTLAAQSRVGTVVTAAIALALSALAGWFLFRSLVKPIGEAVELAQQVSEGDLMVRQRADARNEFGSMLRSLQAMADQMRQAVAEIQRASESVLTASNEIAAGNADLSERTERQAAQLQVAASSLEQLAIAVSSNAQSAQDAARLAQDAAERSQAGAISTERVLGAIERIAESSKSMTDIVVAIEGIVSRTHILAINASVEAAHAGEQGSGFAVVAEEVRSLARRAGTAAQEIRALIERNISNVEVGTVQARDMADVMASMTRTHQQVSDVVSSIAQLATEQSSSVRRVSGVVVQLDQGLQQNAALVEESAAAAQTLTRQAQALSALVRTFRVE